MVTYSKGVAGGLPEGPAEIVVQLDSDGIGLGPSDATSPSVTDGGVQFQYGRSTGLAFTDGVFQPIWADNSVELASVPDPRNFDIASARIAVAQVSHELLAVQMIEVNHTYATAGEFYPTITLVDDSGGSFYFPLVAIVEPDVTAQTSATLPGLTYNPISDRFVGELVITNTSSTDISVSVKCM